MSTNIHPPRMHHMLLWELRIAGQEKPTRVRKTGITGTKLPANQVTSTTHDLSETRIIMEDSGHPARTTFPL